MKKRMMLVLLIPLTGCYNLITVNIGSANHEAGSVGPPLAPEVQCAAFANPKVQIDQIDIEALKTCTDAVVAAKKAKKK
jgi:hypothetical protein